MKSFFVYGGCVSRDVFNPEYNQGAINLSNYIARYSVVKLTDDSVNLNFDTDKITSSFQKKLLKNETSNNLLRQISDSKIDVFLMDCLFLKYKLAFYNKTWLTYSSELKRTGLIRSTHKFISYHDQFFWDKFIEGIERLFQHMSLEGKLEKVFINELFLAKKDSSGNYFSNVEHIDAQNNCLKKAYDILRCYLNPEQFITYDKKLFIANPNHRWGLDPMHFIDDFYHDSYQKLMHL